MSSSRSRKIIGITLLLVLLALGWFGYQQPGLLKAFANLPLC